MEYRGRNLDFTQAAVLVVGDVMLDSYYFGKVERISPEAPVPVIHVTEQKQAPGGAANVSNNTNRLNARSYLLGVAGNDESRKTLVESLKIPCQ